MCKPLPTRSCIEGQWEEVHVHVEEKFINRLSSSPSPLSICLFTCGRSRNEVLFVDMLCPRHAALHITSGALYL